jgi:hypothetical protein
LQCSHPAPGPAEKEKRPITNLAVIKKAAPALSRRRLFIMATVITTVSCRCIQIIKPEAKLISSEHCWISIKIGILSSAEAMINRALCFFLAVCKV